MIAFLKLFGPHIAIAGLLLFGVWKIDQAGYRRAVSQMERQNAAQAKKIETQLGNHMAELDGRLNKRLASIEEAARARSVIIEKDIANDPRYRDPKCALTPSVRDAVNAALRGDSSTAKPDRK